MKLVIAGLLVSLFGLGACASPQKIEESAMQHEMRAQQFEAEGQYAKAQSERRAAQKQHEKAALRRQGL